MKTQSQNPTPKTEPKPQAERLKELEADLQKVSQQVEQLIQQRYRLEGAIMVLREYAPEPAPE